MKNKGLVVFLTIIITFLCVYYLSFTFVSRKVKSEATAYATTEGNVDFSKRDRYLDSISDEVVYDLGFVQYTFQDVQNLELNLGLDLQGGMHVTLEVSPVEIIRGISGNNQDPKFNEAIDLARVRQRESNQSFLDLFYSAFQEVNPDASLASVFANASNRGRISFSSSDSEVLDLLNEEIESAIDRSFIILRTRIDQFGTTNPNIQKLGSTGRIQVELPGVDNKERVRKILSGVAKLEFWEVANPDEYFQDLMAINDFLVRESKKETAPGTVDAEDAEEVAAAEDDLSSLLDEDPADLDSAIVGDSAVVAEDSIVNPLENISPLLALNRGQNQLIYELKDTAVINDLLQDEKVKDLIPSSFRFYWAVKSEPEMPNLLELLVIKAGRGGSAPMTGEAVSTASRGLDDRGAPAVFLNMNPQGAKTWRKLTADNVNRRIAIVLDNFVYSAPVVRSEIPNGRSIINGSFTPEEAQDLSNVLKAGTLPAPTRIVEEAIVGPTLGKEAQVQGITSIVAGLVIVILFVIAYYAGAGFIADIALIFNVFFIIGILVQLQGVALTLPGIAGIVLTIGMSIDANVLIFERIREELRNGSDLRPAISKGYDKAFSSILDSNVTTLLVAIILFVFGQGPVKGFAVTLMVGIGTSFLSAVFVTRVIIEWLASKKNISFKTGLSAGFLSNLNIDFIGKRKIAYLVSGAIIAVGVVLMATNGLKYGVDFKGGRSYVVEFNQPVVSSDLKTSLVVDFQGAGTEVKTFGSSNVLKVTTSYLVDDESNEADQQVEQALVGGIEKFTGEQYNPEDGTVADGTFNILSSSKVGATIADDIKNDSVKSIIFSLLVIFLYILIRFRKWQFSLGAITALAHDTLVVLSAFAIAGLFGFNYEVDQVFIAAMLTIIGYSINDTVVVFDRIRETLGLRSQADFIGNVNISINKTMSRTLITSLTTLIVVIVLLIWGGEVLKGFSFALLVGILVGTYSSVFIATPVVVDLTKDKISKPSSAGTKTQKAVATA